VFVSRVAKYVGEYLAGIMSSYQKEKQLREEKAMLRNSRAVTH